MPSWTMTFVGLCIRSYKAFGLTAQFSASLYRGVYFNLPGGTSQPGLDATEIFNNDLLIECSLYAWLICEHVQHAWYTIWYILVQQKTCILYSHWDTERVISPDTKYKINMLLLGSTFNIEIIIENAWVNLKMAEYNIYYKPKDCHQIRIGLWGSAWSLYTIMIIGTLVARQLPAIKYANDNEYLC